MRKPLLLGGACLFLLISLATIPARAANYTLTFNDQEKAVLLQLLDMAVKQGGLAVAGNADYLAKKIQSAPAVSSQPQPAPDAVPNMEKKP